MKSLFFRLSCIAAFSGLITPGLLTGANVTLVRFGSSAGSTTYGLQGWNTLLKSGSLSYTSQGNGGLIASSDPGEFGDYRGVRGTPRTFSKGERIAVTWTNNSDDIYFFTSRISFTDADEPDETASEGAWYTMRRFTDYRFTYTEILPHSTARTVFNITDSGVHKTNASYSLVNINLHIEWFETWPTPNLICEKIELLDDADTSPPAKPAGLAAAALSDSKIRLTWTAPSDNTGAVEYLIYRDGVIEGYSQETEYTCVYLEPVTEYTFTVTALDAAGNESMASDPVTETTGTYTPGPFVVNPHGFDYLGAFSLPEDFAWGGEAVAYNPDGDGGQTNASDGYPGSLFVTNVNQPENGRVGEVNIPVPMISGDRNPEELNTATVLNAPVDIRPSSINNWEYVDIWRTGLEVVPDEGRLYSTWSIHYTVTGEKHASVSCCALSDLAGSSKRGAWYVGNPSSFPNDAMMSDWLFSIPQEWADANCAGRSLVTGRSRDGGLSGLGPTLYAFAPVGTAPPAANQVLEITPLLEYGSFEGTDNVHFPNSVDGYNHADEWRGASWLTAGSETDDPTQQAVAIIGNKALGQNWYGYNGERMRHDWVIADLPYPEFWETDPDGKGWRAHTRQPMIIFFDPQDLAKTANGEMETYEPQPYAALRISTDLFFGQNHEIFSSAFDSENQILYVTEFVREPEGRLIMHAWKVNARTESAVPDKRMPKSLRLMQNYPNPFNPLTDIRFEVGKPSFVNLKVFNLTGQTIAGLVNERKEAGEHSVRFDASGLPAGIYFYRIETDEFRETRKMILLN